MFWKLTKSDGEYCSRMNAVCTVIILKVNKKEDLLHGKIINTVLSKYEKKESIPNILNYV